MRILIVSLCSLALVSVAVGAQKDEKKSQPKKQAPTAQHATKAAGHPAAGGGAGKKTPATMSGGQRAKTDQASVASYQGQKGKKNQTSNAAHNGQSAKKHQNVTSNG